MLTELESVSTRNITPRLFVFIIDFSSSSLISRPLLMFQEAIRICFGFVFAGFRIEVGTAFESTEAGFPIGIGSGSLVEGRLG